MRKLFPVLLLFTLLSCRSGQEVVDYAKIAGETMGTTYSVIYQGEEDYKGAIDSLLLAFNQEVSTYIPDAVISEFNQSERGIALADFPHYQLFLDNLEQSRAIVQVTDGAFQPTLMPLINYWGFGYTEKRAVTQVDSFRVDSLMNFVGLDLIQSEKDSLLKFKPGVQLDFSAIAKGFGVDLIGQLLEARGVENYFVEIGGEALGRGLSPRGDAWRVGISVPRSGASLGEYAEVATLEDGAVATSGNYRNYYEVEGEKYGHTINPYTGFPEKNNLLSASVFAKDCARADAFATAFMVMGFEKAKAKVESLEDIEAYFIVGEADGTMQTHFSSGLDHLSAPTDMQ